MRARSAYTIITHAKFSIFTHIILYMNFFFFLYLNGASRFIKGISDMHVNQE